MVIGKMTEIQIDQTLRDHKFGYLSLVMENGEPYILTVYYAVDYDGNLIAHSIDMGLVEMLRANPAVCFLVHHYEDSYHWSHVRVYGQYQEVTEESEREKLMARLFHAIPHLTPEESKMTKGLSQAVVYKIIIARIDSEKEEW